MAFEGKTALVTGAGSGIGRLTAQCLAEQGANVVLMDVDEDAIEAAALAFCEKGGEAVALRTDVREYAQICAARDFAIEKYGHIDICVSCAGGFPARILKEEGSFWDWSQHCLDWGVEVNFRAPLYLAHAVIKHMMDRKRGVLIQLGSIAGETGDFSVDYCASKSGVMHGMTKSLALVGAPYGVRANSVSPGPVLTRPEMAKMKTPLGRAAQPQEVVDLILYLCSDKAAFITGANYLIDGGRACGGQN